MKEFFRDLLIEKGFTLQVSLYLSYFILIFLTLLVAVLVDIASKKIIMKMVEKLVRKTKTSWDDVFLEKKGFHYLAHIAPTFVIYLSSSLFPLISNLIQRLSMVYLTLIIMIVIFKFLKATEEVYVKLEISKQKPIRGYVQIFQMVVVIVGGISIFSHLLDKSPWKLLSGIGAMTAVFLLIFKDSILGFVAGIQLSANSMIKIGDWIEMPKYNANGDVIEITLNTVKVRNFDKTITTIPVYSFISDSFINWRGMEEAGSRRIKRSIYIDASTVQICTDEMIEKYKKIHYISNYINKKVDEIGKYNKIKNIDLEQISNGRRLTNIGTFREYVVSYLRNHPDINNNMTLMARQLELTEDGLPIEIYAFCNHTVWVDYEMTQADIFDHLIAVLPEFGLRVFQNPTGNDFKSSFSMFGAQNKS